MAIRYIRAADKAHFVPLIWDLDNYYPGMHRWLRGLELDKHTPVLVAQDNGRSVGVCIGKLHPHERKLRCIRVHQDYRTVGIGIKLIDRMLELLEDERPHCTVSEEMLHQYSRPFINRYGFSLDAVPRGMYRPGKLEYLFNAT